MKTKYRKIVGILLYRGQLYNRMFLNDEYDFHALLCVIRLN